MHPQAKPFMTVEAYLQTEREANHRHEYVNGKVFAIAGGSEEHNLIAGNTYASLHGQLRRRPCRVYSSDMRVKVSATVYTYPDISIVCGEPQFDERIKDTLLNPTVIIEVLSPSTEGYDRGQKFFYNRSLPSLKEYLFLSQDAARAEHYLKQADGSWSLVDKGGLEETVQFPSISCMLLLADTYEKVSLPL